MSEIIPTDEQITEPAGVVELGRASETTRGSFVGLLLPDGLATFPFIFYHS